MSRASDSKPNDSIEAVLKKREDEIKLLWNVIREINRGGKPEGL